MRDNSSEEGEGGCFPFFLRVASLYIQGNSRIKSVIEGGVSGDRFLVERKSAMWYNSHKQACGGKDGTI